MDAHAYVIRSKPGEPYGGRIHLGGIDFNALARYFDQAKHKASIAEATTTAVRRRVDSMVRLNPTRGSLRDQF